MGRVILNTFEAISQRISKLRLCISWEGFSMDREALYVLPILHLIRVGFNFFIENMSQTCKEEKGC